MIEKNRLITIAVIAALVLTAGYLFMANQPTVSAQGSSSLQATPDKVLVYLAIESRNANQQQSQLDNTALADRVRAELSAAGLTEDQITFNGFSSYPEYDWTKGQKLIGYVTRQDITVQLTDFDEVSKTVNAGISGGAYIYSISLELSEEAQTNYKTQALEAASKDAREKAAAQARGLGKSLGGLVSVGTQDFSYYPMPYYSKVSEGAASAMDVDEARSAALSITPRPVDVNAYVSVTYRLRPF